MTSEDSGTDFVLSAISRARAERAARQPGPSKIAPAVSEPRTAVWAELTAFEPDPKHLERHLVRTLRTSAQAQPFDIIRTKLLHQMRSNGWRRVALASPGSGCGKSTLMLNLAFSTARQHELSAMAVELDMRRPTIGQIIGLKHKIQFADVLAGIASPAENMVRIGSNLAIASNHKPAIGAAELLASKTSAHALDRVEADYAPDYMFFDLPPLLMTDDAMAFIDQIDCVLLVAAAEKSSLSEVTRCAEELSARCNFLGVILNKCRFVPKEERYGYRSTYGYGDYSNSDARSAKI